jgi:hypothetical protein
MKLYRCGNCLFMCRRKETEIGNYRVVEQKWNYVINIAR